MLVGAQERELFVAIYLDSRNRAIASEILFAGTIDGMTVHPRELVKSALKHNAAAVIISHNCPCGVAEASRSDVLISEHLRKALALVDIGLLDHLVITAGHAASVSELRQAK